MNPIPHEAIRRSGDRAWTLRLVAALPAATDEARHEIARTLAWLEDPRAVGPLSAWLVDRSAPTALRECASDLLTGEYDPPVGDQLRAWWASDDPVLRRHALGCMGPNEADVVLSVAADPAHPLQVDALRAMISGFEEPHHHAILIDALAHPDAAVRSTAADVLVMEEPAAAELPLLSCATDADPDVACAAIETLAYYPTRRVVRALAAIRDDADRDPDLRDAADAALREIAGSAASRARGPDDPRHLALLAWVAPIRDPLGLTDADLAVLPREPVARPPVVANADPHALGRALDDPDFPLGALRSLLERLVAAADRAHASLGSRLLRHADPVVRSYGVAHAAAIGDTDDVVAALDDPSRQVRAAAGYHLRSLPVDPKVAPLLWSLMSRETGFRASEALESWLVHAAPDEVPGRLVALVHTDRRSRVGHVAVRELARRGAVAAIRTLLPLLNEPPRGTWALHLALLHAAATLGLPIGPHGLDEVDHLDVACALGPHRRAN